MKKQTKGSMVFLDGEQFYKIENYDFMSDFFMTITSSSDVWNFLWSQGGISAGRKNCDFSIFPYYTSDKIQDTKNSTGSVTLIKIKTDGLKGKIWQPFENLFSSGKQRFEDDLSVQRNLYKNLNGSKIWFEEVNLSQGLVFRYGWTSSAKYGLVKMSRIENLTDRKISLEVLDGCRNIMSSSSDAPMQLGKSNLLDAYKKSEVVADGNFAVFTLSSVVTDKAEPSESLNTNVSWFTTNDPVILSNDAVQDFIGDRGEFLYQNKGELNGRRGECYIVHKIDLLGKSAECWEQVLDVDYDAAEVVQLQSEIENRENAYKLLRDDILETEAALEANIQAADGIQETKNKISDLHHRTNVMFNIMRGGLFNDNGLFNIEDFKLFTSSRNAELGKTVQKIKSEDELKAKCAKNLQLKRLYNEYLPITFSRRHGDPSRPWNRFDIQLKDEKGNNRIYYEGNWRDIFQNWEALLWSYPEYSPKMISVFMNAITVDGFNPYRISRNGIDWEVPEKGNPWAQYGYWGDHQVIYLQKFLEFQKNLNTADLLSMMNEKSFATANLPYRLKSYAEICADPRNSIIFDYDQNAKLKNLEKTYGTDARLVLDDKNNVQLTTMATKLVQILLAKLLNHVPGAGIWMNTQRPEWNDANNALAGYGASVVTACYLYRMLKFLEKLYSENKGTVLLSKTVHQAFVDANQIYSMLNSSKGITSIIRKNFTDSCGAVFENEIQTLYKNGYSDEYVEVSGKEFASSIGNFAEGVKRTIEANRRSDGLFHAYNTIRFDQDGISIVNLKLMLEGQVAVLSSGLLSKEEVLGLTENLRKSELFEENQHSYLLYPNTKLPSFMEKNNFFSSEILKLKGFIERTGNTILKQDIKGVWHFNPLFRNADILKEFISKLPAEKMPSEAEKTELLSLYENKFHHQTFTGRSGTFYAYEGLGSIYWHMVSKLLLAVQENLSSTKDSLNAFYKDVKKGLGSAKTPSEYGAFPFDPYSHTPYRRGAQQPGMTGQVKEEIIARFGELGVKIQNGEAVFAPSILEKSEFESGKLTFSWCGTKITYDSSLTSSVKVIYKNGEEKSFAGNTLPCAESSQLFSRSGNLSQVIVGLK